MESLDLNFLERFFAHCTDAHWMCFVRPDRGMQVDGFHTRLDPHSHFSPAEVNGLSLSEIIDPQVCRIIYHHITAALSGDRQTRAIPSIVHARRDGIDHGMRVIHPYTTVIGERCAIVRGCFMPELSL